MQNAESYVILGPKESLSRLIPTLSDETSPRYYYKYQSEQSGDQLVVAVYQEQKKVTNESQTLTLVIEESDKTVKATLMPSGGRTGFRGGSSDGEPPVYDVVKDFILEFTDRFGLTIQELKQEEEKSEENDE